MITIMLMISDDTLFTMLLLTFVLTMLLTLKLTWSLDPNVWYSYFGKMQRTTSVSVDSGWGWLEGSVYVDVNGSVVVDIDVDIYANVGNSRLGKMPRAPRVCVGGRCGWLGRRERLDVVCDLGPGLRGPYTRPPAEGEGPYTRPKLYAAQYARPWVGRTDAEREERRLGV